MNARIIALLAFTATASLAGIPPTAAAEIDRLAWLSGRWTQEVAQGLREEYWLEPSGGTMLGIGRTVAGGKTVEYEYLRIEERGASLFYVASPLGQSTASFRAIEIRDSLAVFEDPDHDFPQRIRYRLAPDGSLLAQIEGVVQGKLHAIDFPMRRDRYSPGVSGAE